MYRALLALTLIPVAACTNKEDLAREADVGQLVRYAKEGDILGVATSQPRIAERARKDPAVIQLLLDRLGEEQHIPTILHLVETLGYCGDTATAAAGSLRKMLPKGDARLRCAAAEALIRITREDEGLAFLRDATKGEDPELRLEAVFVLGELAELGRGSEAELRQVMAEGRAEERIAAAFSLFRATGESKASVDALIAMARDEKFEDRPAACERLASFRERGRPAVPLLEELSKNGDATLRAAASDALSRIRHNGFGIDLPQPKSKDR